MASISTDGKTGLKRLVFTGLDGNRRAIHLGKVSDRTAQSMTRCVEGLLDSALAGQAPSPQTTAIVESLSSVMEDKLVKVELIHPRDENKQLTLVGFLAG